MAFQRLISLLFEYETPKIVTIRSVKIGLLSRFIQVCILAYIVGFVMIYNKGYQEVGNVESGVTTKVKGITFTNFSAEDFQIPSKNQMMYNRIWDVSDYVIPPSENEAFFVMTNVVITPNQTLGECDEDPDVVGALCGPGQDTCVKGHAFHLGSGAATGRCIDSSQKPGTKVCEVSAWCPVEVDVLPLKNNRALLDASENYTVLIKNSIVFPKFGEQYRRNNILRSSNATYLRSCIYDPITDPFCPIFLLGDIVRGSGYNYSEMAVKGGVMSINIHWDCDLDWDFFTYCRPKYTFHRLDEPDTQISKGWNFRYSYNYEYNRRTQLKAYGIKFLIDVQGQARKFNIIPTLLNIGAGLALMSVTTICCDLVLLYLVKSRQFYKDKKYLDVEGEDAFGVIRDGYTDLTDC